MPTNIPDYATYYRQRQLYAPDQSQAQAQPQFQQQGNLRFPALEEYANQVSRPPQRADHKPRFWDRLVAGMSGFSEGGLRGGSAGVSAADEVLTSPYRRALQDYNIRLGGYKGAADVEGEIFNRGQSINSQRLREILGMLSAQVASRRAGAAESQAETAAQRLPLYQQDVETRRRRGDAYGKFTTEIYPQIQRERIKQSGSIADRRADLYGQRTSSMERTAIARINKPPAAPKERYVSPKDQNTVDGLALKEIRLQAPDLYAEFVQEIKDPTGVIKSVRIKGATGTKPGRLWGENPLTSDEVLQQNERFERFQSLLDSARVSILQRSGLSAAGYPAVEGDELTENEDEQGVLEEDEEE